jgi:hypothetical protein
MVVETQEYKNQGNPEWDRTRKQYFAEDNAEEKTGITAAKLISTLESISSETLPRLKESRESAEVELTEIMEKLACENREMVTAIVASSTRIAELHKELCELKPQYAQYCKAKLPPPVVVEPKATDLGPRYGYVSALPGVAKPVRWTPAGETRQPNTEEDEFKPRWTKKESTGYDSGRWDNKKDNWYSHQSNESQTKPWKASKDSEWSRDKYSKQDDYYKRNWSSNNFETESYDRPDSRNSYKTESNWSDRAYDKNDSWAKDDKWSSQAPVLSSSRTYTKLPPVEDDQVPSHIKSRLIPKSIPSPPASRLYNSSSWGASGSFS